MANEITVTGSLSVKNGYLEMSRDMGQLAVTQTTKAGGQPGSIACTTTDTAISITGLTSPKWCWMRNVGSNPIKVGPTSGGAIVPMVQLAAGEAAILPLVASVALRCQTTTSTSTLDLMVLDA